MTVARRVVLWSRSRPGALASVAAFVIMWLHLWSAWGDGTGRAAVMESPWRFWVPPALAVAGILIAGGEAWSRSEAGAWIGSVVTSLVFFIPLWLVALLPAAFAVGLIKMAWPVGLLGLDRGPEEWFAGYHGGHIGMTGEGLSLMAVIAGLLAAVMLAAMGSTLHALLRRPPSGLGVLVSGSATGGTILALSAFVAFTVPGQSAPERARTTSVTEARRYALTQRTGANLALWNAARRGNLGDVELLLHSGLSPDAANSFGYTALIMAAEDCQTLVVDTLLRYGASVKPKDNQGRDAMAHAIGAHGDAACGQTILALSRGGALPQRDQLCARRIEAMASGDRRLVDVLTQTADQNGMTDVVASCGGPLAAKGRRTTDQLRAGAAGGA
jgi:ankyrin repeat protein